MPLSPSMELTSKKLCGKSQRFGEQRCVEVVLQYNGTVALVRFGKAKPVILSFSLYRKMLLAML